MRIQGYKVQYALHEDVNNIKNGSVASKSSIFGEGCSGTIDNRHPYC